MSMKTLKKIYLLYNYFHEKLYNNLGNETTIKTRDKNIVHTGTKPFQKLASKIWDLIPVGGKEAESPNFFKKLNNNTNNKNVSFRVGFVWE